MKGWAKGEFGKGDETSLGEKGVKGALGDECSMEGAN